MGDEVDKKGVIFIEEGDWVGRTPGEGVEIGSRRGRGEGSWLEWRGGGSGEL